MKPGVILINTARGAIIREKDLVDALESGHISAAGLDVVEDEPLKNERLRSLSNCLITPHSAFYSDQSLSELRTKIAKTVEDALLNRPLHNIVNKLEGIPDGGASRQSHQGEKR
jgi:phosphoglycerate dehydrogenase-like enzyme